MKFIALYLKTIVFIGVAIAIGSCSPEDDRTVKIVDFTKPQTWTFTVANDPSQANLYVVGARLFVKGEIRGDVYITTTAGLGGKLSGKIDTSFFTNEFYSTKTEMNVSPISQAKGELKITFRFLKI